MEVHLVDGTYELFRHFFGQPPRASDDGEEIGAARGVILSIVGMLADGATHVGVATDHVIESFRNELWPGYKTGEGIAPELRSQFEPLERALDALGVTVWPMVELEADDALASAAAVAAEDPTVDRVFICTPDKDLAQCVVGERVVQLDRRSGKVSDEAGVWAKFGVAPGSIPDWLALVGDTADGFPGLAGWGKRSASVVLAHYGSFDDVPDRVARVGSGGPGRGAGSGQAGRTARQRTRPGRAVQSPGHAPGGQIAAQYRGVAAVARAEGDVRRCVPGVPRPRTGRAGGGDTGPLTRRHPLVPKTSSSSVGTGVSSCE